MSKVPEKKTEKNVYENLTPISCVDAIRVGMQEEKKYVVLEFGYRKSPNIINIDVRKQLTITMVENLIENLKSCLDEMK